MEELLNEGRRRILKELSEEEREEEVFTEMEEENRGRVEDEEEWQK